MTYIKPRVVCLKETEYWLDDDLIKKAGEIYGVYVFDANRVVHCCEMTGSYELYALEVAIVNWEDDDEARDEIEEQWNMGTEPVTYMHCHSVDEMPTFQEATQRCKAAEYDETWEALMEYYRSCGVYYKLPED